MELFPPLKVQESAFVQHLNSILTDTRRWKKKEPAPNIPFLNIKLAHFPHQAEGSVFVGEAAKTPTLGPKTAASLRLSCSLGSHRTRHRGLNNFLWWEKNLEHCYTILTNSKGRKTSKQYLKGSVLTHQKWRNFTNYVILGESFKISGPWFPNLWNEDIRLYNFRSFPDWKR